MASSSARPTTSLNEVNSIILLSILLQYPFELVLPLLLFFIVILIVNTCLAVTTQFIVPAYIEMTVCISFPITLKVMLMMITRSVRATYTSVVLVHIVIYKPAVHHRRFIIGE